MNEVDKQVQACMQWCVDNDVMWQGTGGAFFKLWQHFSAQAIASASKQEWKPIDTAPEREVVLFLVAPLTKDDPHYCDTSGSSILIEGKPRIMMGKFRTWSALEKGIGWMPLPPIQKEMK